MCRPWTERLREHNPQPARRQTAKRFRFEACDAGIKVRVSGGRQASVILNSLASLAGFWPGSISTKPSALVRIA
jgi:hypothetical protein